MKKVYHNATANSSGVYTFQVSNNWSGTVTPSKVGFSFVPGNRAYTNVVTGQVDQNYTARPTPFSFASMGDGQAETAYFTATVNQIKNLNPALILYNVDLQDTGFVATQIDPMINVLKTANVFNKTFLVRGNSGNNVEGSAALWENYFETAPNIKVLPPYVTNKTALNSSSDHLNYSFDYGNSIFIGLDVPGDIDFLEQTDMDFLNFRLTYAEGQWRKMVADYFTAEVIGNREKFDLQYRIIRPNDKEERWVHCVGDLKWSDDNKPLKLVATVQNITVIKQSEMLLKQKNEEFEIAKAKAEESDRLKSAFLANMSHEIRTPMSGILGFADLLKTPGLTGDQQQNYIRIIEKSGARMLNIINDIIDISKIESHLMEVNIQQININEQIEYVYHFFKPEVEAKGMKLYLRNSLATKDSILKTDKEKFFAILTNLVKNAVKFTNTGSIEMGYIIKNNDAKEELQFYVKDTGIGNPKERQGVIFERFVQANINNKMALQGADLGLSIAKGYVEMLQGKIWAESEVGIGSTFYFTLPYNNEPKKPTEQNILPAEKTYNRISNVKILLAEDDEIAEMLFDLSAKPFFKNIIKARNGIEAVETCRNNPDIDIVLMDVQMPLMDGHEATRKIREFNKDVVIIAQTAFGLAGDREKALEAGCNTYISKPFRIIELLELIHDYFN